MKDFLSFLASFQGDFVAGVGVGMLLQIALEKTLYRRFYKDL